MIPALRLRLCWLLASSPLMGCGATPAVPPPIEIAHELWAGYFPLDVAVAEFSPVSAIRVDVREDSEALFADFAGGRYDGIAASMVDLLRLQQFTPGLRIVACTDESSGADAVIAHARIPNIAALRGKRIGVSLGSFAELLVARMLESAGLSTSDVRLVNMDASAAPALLKADSVDAIETWEPYLQQVTGPAYRTLYSTAETPGLVMQCLMLRDRLLLERPADVEQLVQRVFTVVDRFAAHPDSAAPLAAAALTRPVASLPSIRGIRWLTADVNRRLLGAEGLPPALPSLAQPLIRFLAGVGQLRTPPEVPSLLAPRFLPAASPVRSAR